MEGLYYIYLFTVKWKRIKHLKNVFADCLVSLVVSDSIKPYLNPVELDYRHLLTLSFTHKQKKKV